MKTFLIHASVNLSCRIYDALIRLHAEPLQRRYSDEMKLVFRESMTEASTRGFFAMLELWTTVAAELAIFAGPACAPRIGILAASIAGSTALVLVTALGFCTVGPLTVVHGYTATMLDATLPGHKDRLVTMPEGQKIFLSCWEPRELHEINTVILVTGRGIGDHTGWVPLQTAVSDFARVCSYDPLGAGKSDPLPVAHTPATPTVDELTDQMHTLFGVADLPKPYILVGTSAGGVLARRYESKFPGDVGGFVFADSAHEEQEWRDAAIAPSFSPGLSNAEGLRADGMLLPGEHLAWHDDVPIIVLERGERAPCDAFPNLTLTQCNAINDAWHSFQVDLSHRSKYAQLRVVPGAGHRMVMQKPEVVAQAIQDVIGQIDVVNQTRR